MNALYRTSLLALYQLTVTLGIVLMPVALLARKAGVTLPIGRLVETISNAYENASRTATAR